ncbi:hypothetical protein TSUD_361250 [Trifolium subterraneum]|uniref:3-methyl-2-oxobutanoate hydroxymethyltransferase n=1 Tax=Trifolium subterraneum TaxID=3900 RepID=A0A2Z6MMN1_TRISU|nr:hypothetical protein TSUD_361250 [Trifolium subterraneum]
MEQHQSHAKICIGRNDKKVLQGITHIVAHHSIVAKSTPSVYGYFGIALSGGCSLKKRIVSKLVSSFMRGLSFSYSGQGVLWMSLRGGSGALSESPIHVMDEPNSDEESDSRQTMKPLWAVDAAVRILKEGGMDAIKLEGGSPSRIVAAKAIVEAGIAVIGHVGLTPQAISVLGGFRPQGRNVASAVKVVETALALQEAGCFAVVLECVPAPVAAAATAALQIPTIGIGAGPYCSGQVLVYHDLLGMLQHPHHAKVTPKFCKQYARVGDVINKALVDYKEDVINGSFPDAQHSPYKISETDANGFLNELQKLGFDKAASATSEAVQKMVTNKVII